MIDDASDHEVSVSAELTPTSVKAGAKSRLISALDHLGANLLGLLNVPLERRNDRSRAVGRADVKLIDQLGDLRLEQLGHDPEFAEAALQRHLKTAISRQSNKANVAALALEDLRREPPTEEQSGSGAESLSDDFLSRFERYAEDATSEQLRERWGRVLASEIRKPGTFSAKVLRIVDELEPTTAALFENVCQHRVGGVLPLCLLPEIGFEERKRLITAGLLLDPGLSGQVRVGTELTDSNGEVFHAVSFDSFVLAFAKSDSIKVKQGERSVLADYKGKLSLRVWVLTDEGHAISSILPNVEEDAVNRLFQALADEVRPAETREYRPQAGQLVMTRSLSL